MTTRVQPAATRPEPQPHDEPIAPWERTPTWLHLVVVMAGFAFTVGCFCFNLTMQFSERLDRVETKLDGARMPEIADRLGAIEQSFARIEARLDDLQREDRRQQRPMGK